jgi:hypothetical protein
MVLVEPRNPEIPVLTRLSHIKGSPKYTIVGHHVRKVDRSLSLGPGEYGVGNIDKTTKFRSISRPCSFSSDARFADDRPKKSREPGYPSPGFYDIRQDFSHTPHASFPSHAIERSQRIFPKFYFKDGEKSPGPVYEVRGKDRRLNPSLATNAPAVAGRHGWYYDVDIKQQEGKPGVGQYNPKEAEHGRAFGFGASHRPELYSQATKTFPGPGGYPIKPHVIDGPRYSFQKASLTDGSGFVRTEPTPSFMTAQPTQFT